jgi:hypothetical protein
MRRFLVLIGLVSLACATGAGPSRYDFFAPATASDVSGSDPWFPKVEEWQARAVQELDTGLEIGAEPLSLRAASRSGELRLKMGAYRSEERRKLAARINGWAQQEARRHYKWDPSKDPAYDHWPTLQELLETNGDDCDGLDLIAYQLLLEFGFQRDDVYRLIVRRDRDGANHMVTLWFDDRSDPWVLDATGALTRDMRRFSEFDGWTPTKMFNEHIQFAVTPHPRLVRDP